jgi:hypothetical protein
MRPGVVLSALLVFAVSVPVGIAASRGAGTLSVENGVGYVSVRGQGTLVGRMDRGEVVVVDATVSDPWSPRINGVPRGKIAGLRGKDITFFIPGGRYRIALRGDGISLSARGVGVAMLRARPGARFDTGTYAAGDSAPAPLPDDLVRVPFGSPQDSTP